MRLGTPEATALARVGAAAGSGDPGRLVDAFEAAVAETPVEDLEEVLLQTYLFAGFPRTINAFYTWQGWLVRTGRGRGKFVVEPDDVSDWRHRGEELCRLIYGDHYEALQRRLARLHPELASWTLVEGYGKVLARPGPDPARRELAALGALVALGVERQLASHLRGALHAGVERAVLVEAMTAIAAEWGREALVETLLAELP